MGKRSLFRHGGFRLLVFTCLIMLGGRDSLAATTSIVREPKRIFGLGQVKAAAWSPDGTRVAIGSNNFVALYKVSTGQSVLTILDRNTGGTMLDEPGIRSLAFSRNGKLLATGNNRGEARIWDAVTGALKRTIKVQATGKTGIVNGVDFTFDAKYLVTALGYTQDGMPTSEGSLKLWDAATGGLKRTFSTTQYMTCVACSPVKIEIVSGDSSGVARLWNNSQNIAVRTYEGLYNVTCHDVAFSRSGTKVAAALEKTSWGDTNAALLWNTAAAAQVHAYVDNTDKVYSVDFTAGGSLITGAYGKAKRWSTASGYALQKTYSPFDGAVCVASLSPDASGAQLLVAANTWGGEVRLLNTSTGNRIRIFHGHNRGVKSLAFMPDGTRFLAGAESYSSEMDMESAQARMYDFGAGKELFSLTNSGGSTIVDITPDGKTLMTATFGNGLKVWNASGGLIREIKERDSKNELVSVNSGCAAFAAGGSRIISGITQSVGYNQSEGVVKIFNWATGVKEREIRPLDDELTALGTYSGKLGHLLAAGTRVLGVTYSGKTHLYGMDGTSGGSPINYAGWIYTTAFSPTGRHLAIGGTNGVVLWDLKQGKQLYYFPSQGFALAFSPDGLYLAAGDGWTADNYGDNGYGRAQVWSVRNGTPLKTFQVQRATVMTLAYTPDGTGLLSGSLDGTVAVWDGLPSKAGAAAAWRIYE